MFRNFGDGCCDWWFLGSGGAGWCGSGWLGLDC